MFIYFDIPVMLQVAELDMTDVEMELSIQGLSTTGNDVELRERLVCGLIEELKTYMDQKLGSEEEGDGIMDADAPSEQQLQMPEIKMTEPQVRLPDA